MPKSKGGFHAARVPAIKEEAKQCDFPWHDVFDTPLLDWLEIFSRAHNTVKEIMFAAILPTVSALLGPNTCVKVLETYEEPVNFPRLSGRAKGREISEHASWMHSTAYDICGETSANRTIDTVIYRKWNEETPAMAREL